MAGEEQGAETRIVGAIGNHVLGGSPKSKISDVRCFTAGEIRRFFSFIRSKDTLSWSREARQAVHFVPWESPNQADPCYPRLASHLVGIDGGPWVFTFSPQNIQSRKNSPALRSFWEENPSRLVKQAQAPARMMDQAVHDVPTIAFRLYPCKNHRTLWEFVFLAGRP